MATLRDAALAEYQWKLADAAAQEAAKVTALQNAARQLLVPVFTDHTGKVVIDPMSKTDAIYTDFLNGLVILRTNDGSNITLGVKVSPVGGGEVFDVAGSGSEWTRGVPVSTLAELGSLVQKGDV